MMRTVPLCGNSIGRQLMRFEGVLSMSTDGCLDTSSASEHYPGRVGGFAASLDTDSLQGSTLVALFCYGNVNPLIVTE